MCRGLLFGPSDMAYMRALGYPNPHEFRKAWDVNDPDLYERDRLARIKLLEKFGVSWEHEWEEIIEAFKRMETGFPGVPSARPL